ncbi:MAG TPA: peptide chain release factor N(5)-glutamine methyltransferase [Pyrinomonadaceae bacterium]|nr:peptide chain release factor N(5)-glutamine methyltransferase [Pyrinomonadaceae bacterium]
MDFETEADCKTDVSIATALNEGAETLRASGVNEPRLEAALLLGHILKCSRSFIIAHDDQSLSSDQSQTFAAFVARRAAGEPLQYITGHQEFYKLDFLVTPDVLIPRPETEMIVEAVLEFFPSHAHFTFADVGTGSGCIAISILHERRHAQAKAIDESESALQVAAQNAARHHVIDRMRLVRANLFSASPQDERFDLIVSNPPYVPDGELSGLQREVQCEPRPALAGGADGLDVIRRLLAEAPGHLSTGGHLIFEFGINQDKTIAGLVPETVWELIEIRQDLQQIPRMIILRKK